LCRTSQVSIRGRAVRLNFSTSLMWNPSSTTLPYVQVSRRNFRLFGPAGTTGIELEGLSGSRGVLRAVVPLQKYYPTQKLAAGLWISSSSTGTPRWVTPRFLIRLRPGAATQGLFFHGEHAPFCRSGRWVDPACWSPCADFRFELLLLRAGRFSLTLSNPKPYSGPEATQ